MNTPIRFALCDDERAETAHLAALVREWAALRGVTARVTEYPGAESFLFALADEPADVLLLDIQMGGMDGVTLAKTVRAGNREMQIIFVTGYMEYIADGYDVEALHYLLKPVSGEKLFAILDRAAGKLTRNGRALLVSHGGESVRIPLYEIRYCEVWHNDVTIHTGAGMAYTVRKTLAEVEAELDDGFFRTGRSYIVNLNYVRKTTKTGVHLSGGMVVPLSRGLYEAINRALIERL